MGKEFGIAFPEAATNEAALLGYSAGLGLRNIVGSLTLMSLVALGERKMVGIAVSLGLMTSIGDGLLVMKYGDRATGFAHMGLAVPFAAIAFILLRGGTGGSWNTQSKNTE